MNSALHKLLVYQFTLLIFLLYESNNCEAQQIIRLHDELRGTNYYRYLSSRGESSLLLNSREGNELDIYLKFSPVLSQPIYLVIFCYEKKIFEAGTKAVVKFKDGTTLEMANTGKRSFNSMFLFDITPHKSKFTLSEVEKINITDKSGKISNDYYFNQHSGYFINFFTLYSKMRAGYNAIAASDTIQ